MLAITRDPIDVEALTRAVFAPEVGGVVTFFGTVRDHAEGRSVLHLEYEAYEAMALIQLKAILGEVEARWGITRVAVVHRVGPLQLGDIAVGIAVGSAHRREAFEACHHIIDRIKETVPIWKKEFYHDGSQWKAH